jgi:hypothetical protein
MLGDRAGRECLGEIASDDEDADKDDFVLPLVRWAHLRSAFSKFKPAHEETDSFHPTPDNRRPPTTTVLSPATGKSRQPAQPTPSTSQDTSTKGPPSVRSTSSLKRALCVSDDEGDDVSIADFDADRDKCPTCLKCKDNAFNLAQHIEKMHQPLGELMTKYCEAVLKRKLCPPAKKKPKNT